ncbi:hypothetical protein L6164_005917 [Bauhinia variegata]|uniref:Uncharacterized protein n=2 Tax=Bauhinia variegata TaxID=167791 RepID=A0ACB9PSM1_BAUVA|nr:hypothetical protein L6164_005917 [Bauhinia variegata]
MAKTSSIISPKRLQKGTLGKIDRLLGRLAPMMTIIMFVSTMFGQFLLPSFRSLIQQYTRNLIRFLYPYIEIKFHEFIGEGFNLKRNEAFAAIQTYLSVNSTRRAKRLTAEVVKSSQDPLMLDLDDSEEITDEFKGVKLWWVANKITQNQKTDRRFYTLTFHKRYRDLVTASYIQRVMEEGRAIATRNRQLKLFTNNSSNGWFAYRMKGWSHVVFEHPATFETLAMEPSKKEEIMNDLVKFKKGKEYYAKIGKAWKRGYLLYGPPGTGKSSMIAAMANFLNYDVYDLELTSVKDNTELRKLLIETTGKSIMVIEDIDCSLDLTGRRTKTTGKVGDEKAKQDTSTNKKDKPEENKSSHVTLSGLLNFIDGLWSACGGERIIVFTTNFVDKLDPALIRRGRMDKHIELSYCCYEAFKVLAKNYLGVESHELFPEIEKLLGETNMTPADVAENLMPKSTDEGVENCFNNLIQAIEVAKEEAKKKAEKEAKRKEEKEAKRKAKEEAEMKAEKEESQLEAERKQEEVDQKEMKSNGKSAEDTKENDLIH